MFLRILAGAALALALVQTAAAQDLGACAWSRLSPSERASVVAAYQANPRAGGSVLRPLDPKVQAGAAACAQRRDIPALWVQLAVGAEALQASAAGKLQALKRLDRKALDAAWAQAPDDTRDCLRTAATKSFHIPNPPPCRDEKTSALWILQRLGIRTPAAEPEAASWALLYYAAKGHTDYAEALFAHLQAEPRGARSKKTSA